MKYFLILFVLLPCAAQAQPTIFDPTNVKWENVKAANTLSNIGVSAAIGWDVYDVFKSPDKKHASIVLAKKYAILIVITETTKYIIHRTRPDKSDNKSFPSEHTAFASGHVYLLIPVAYLRMGADKHYLTDTLGGYGIRKFLDWKVK